MSRVIIVGAGIAGLTLAYTLRETHDVTILERDAHAGGKIRSESVDGYLFDWGPTGFLSRASELIAIANAAGLADEMTEANPAAAKRSIYWNGALHALPTKPPRMLSMSLLSPRGKLRVLGDLFSRKPPAGSASDESVLTFAQRHFGREVAERIVAPALLGVSAGDAATTSIAAMFPRLHGAEREHGSVIRGMRRGGAKPGRLTGFGAAGMQRFTDRLAELLGDRLRCNNAVERIERTGSGWRVSIASNSGASHGEHSNADGSDATIEADTVIVTAPSDVAADLLAACDADLASELRSIRYAAMRVVGVAFRASDIPTPLDGFGFLVARGQGVRILGALYTSTIYPDQSPAGVGYLRVFLGGTTDPAASELDSAAARAIVLADLATTLGVRADPIAYHEAVWPRAIPQYDLGHPARLERIDRALAGHPGLFLAGNAYRGLGVGDTVADAVALANRVA